MTDPQDNPYRAEAVPESRKRLWDEFPVSHLVSGILILISLVIVICRAIVTLDWMLGIAVALLGAAIAIPGRKSSHHDNQAQTTSAPP